MVGFTEELKDGSTPVRVLTKRGLIRITSLQSGWLKLLVDLMDGPGSGLVVIPATGEEGNKDMGTLRPLATL